MTATSLPKNPSPPRARRGLRILYRATVLLLLTELALQSMAFFAWKGRDIDAAETAASAQTVLCIGDSLTHGTGATHPTMAYPAQLARLLQDQTDHEWNVINDGWPGRNSRQVTTRIRDQLDTFDPGTVCILVGANDFWSAPARLDRKEFATEPATGFPIRFRLGLIASIAVHLMFDDAGPAAAMAGNANHAFLGIWHNAQLDIRFSPNGHLTLGAIEGHWYLRAGALELHLGARNLPTKWTVVDDTLELDGAWPTKLSFTRGEPSVDRPIQAGWRACHSGDLDTARAEFLRAIKDPATEAKARLGIIHMNAAQGDRTAVRKDLEWFVDRAKETDTPTTAAHLVDAYIEADLAGPAIEKGCALILRDPLQYASWRALARYGERAEFRELAKTCIDTALQSETTTAALRIDLLRSRASLLRHSDPSAALIDHLRAVLQDGNEIHLVLELRRQQSSYPRALFVSCTEQVTDKPEERQSLIEIFEKATAAMDSATPETLAHHLEIVVDTCQARGTKVVLLTYPYYAPRVESIVARLSQRDGVTRADVRTRFDKLLTKLSREDLFVLDGHCNDRGYTEMAELVAAAIAKR